MSSHRTETSIMIHGGTYFDPHNPKAEDVDLAALDRGLQMPRFNNQTTRPVTISDHMVRCARIWVAMRLYGISLSREHHVLTPLEWLDVLLALVLHDVAEGFLGDRLRPLKTDYDRALEQAVLAVCIERLVTLEATGYGFHNKTPHPRHYDIMLLALRSQHVKDVDWIACRIEALLWQPGAYDWAAPRESESEAFCVAVSVADHFDCWRPTYNRILAVWVEANAQPHRAESLVAELVVRLR